MESKAKVLGHPIHPMLIVFPMGLFATAVIFDVIALVSGRPMFTTVAFYVIGAGIIGALTASLFGVIDYLAIAEGTRAKSIGALHGAGNAVVTALFIGSFWIRYGSPDHLPTHMALTLSFGGAALAALTGWLGGELVSRLGVGVSDTAHLNAPGPIAPVEAKPHSGGSVASRA